MAVGASVPYVSMSTGYSSTSDYSPETGRGLFDCCVACAKKNLSPLFQFAQDGSETQWIYPAFTRLKSGLLERYDVGFREQGRALGCC